MTEPTKRKIELREGLVLEYERSFTRKNILDFAELTGDFGAHHVNPAGRVMAHGLLVTSIVTKLGGDLDYISRTMDLEFLAPVYEDEPVKGRITLLKLQTKPTRVKLEMLCEVLRMDGTLVLKGTSKGQVWRESAS